MDRVDTRLAVAVKGTPKCRDSGRLEECPRLCSRYVLHIVRGNAAGNGHHVVVRVQDDECPAQSDGVRMLLIYPGRVSIEAALVGVAFFFSVNPLKGPLRRGVVGTFIRGSGKRPVANAF